MQASKNVHLEPLTAAMLQYRKVRLPFATPADKRFDYKSALTWIWSTMLLSAEAYFSKDCLFCRSEWSRAFLCLSQTYSHWQFWVYLHQGLTGLR